MAKLIQGKNDLATLRPDLAAQWDYENNSHGPEWYTLYSMKKISWKCQTCGQSWEATIASRSNGNNCPFCAGSRPISGRTDLATLRPDLAAQWDYEKNERGPENYTQFSQTRVFWKCPACSQFWIARIADRSKNHNCPYCAGKRPIPGKTDFATLRPDLLAQWDYEKNECGPECYTLRSEKKVFWICPTCGQSWLAMIADRSNGANCPYCAGRYPIPGKNDLATLRPDLAAQWDYEKNERGPENYTQFAHARVSWKCSVCDQSWVAEISSRCNKHGCPYCAGERPILGKNDLATLRPDLAAQWDYEKNERDPENYTQFSKAHVFWKCSVCGQSWVARIADRSKSHNCPYCAGKRPIPGKTDFATLRPDLAAQWDYEKNDCGPECYTLRSEKKVFWICPTCGQSWAASIVVRRNNHNCPYCAGKRPIPGKNDFATLRPDLAAQWDYEKNDCSPERYTLPSTKKIYWICPTCGLSWLATICSRSNGSNCPYCAGIRRKKK